MIPHGKLSIAIIRAEVREPGGLQIAPRSVSLLYATPNAAQERAHRADNFVSRPRRPKDAGVAHAGIARAQWMDPQANEPSNGHPILNLIEGGA